MLRFNRSLVLEIDNSPLLRLNLTIKQKSPSTDLCQIVQLLLGTYEDMRIMWKKHILKALHVRLKYSECIHLKWFQKVN